MGACCRALGGLFTRYSMRGKERDSPAHARTSHSYFCQRKCRRREGNNTDSNTRPWTLSGKYYLMTAQPSIRHVIPGPRDRMSTDILRSQFNKYTSVLFVSSWTEPDAIAYFMLSRFHRSPHYPCTLHFQTRLHCGLWSISLPFSPQSDSPRNIPPPSECFSGAN